MFLQFCRFFSISVSHFCQFSRFNWCILVLFSFHVVLAKYWRKRSPGEWKSLLGFFFITEAFAAISLLTANNKWWSLWRCLVRKKNSRNSGYIEVLVLFVDPMPMTHVFTQSWKYVRTTILHTAGMPWEGQWVRQEFCEICPDHCHSHKRSLVSWFWKNNN